ncbi:MAG: tetratricopeptide repeat protein [Acidobacteria bacterium]|nr:tetratricopeptide repeat protein [Acidobacteriota bacterium]
MYRKISLIVTSVFIIVAVTGNVSADQDQPPNPKAKAVADRALADLAAWKNQNARNYLLKQKNEFGSTPQYQAAWALLEIQDGASGKKEMAKRGVDSLSQLSKNAAVDAVASYYLGEVLYEQNKRKEANAAWQTAAKQAETLTKKYPTDPTSHYYLGASLVRAKKYQQARDELLTAVRAGFDPAMVNHQIGLSYLFAESWQEAKESFDLGLAVEPRYAPMYFWRAMAWEKLDRKDEMLIDLDQYVKLAPDGPFAGKARAVLKSAGR